MMEKLNFSMISNKQSFPEKVLQFGEGNFLRAFVDWQIDVMNEAREFNGSVVVVQPRGYEKIEKLKKQDYLYTLYLQGVKDNRIVKEHRIIQSISRGINLYSEYDLFVELAHQEELRFVFSNTTEAGIIFEETDQLADCPQKSFPGKLTAFLYERFKAFKGDLHKGLIIIPCELIEKNGETLKEIVLQYADLWGLNHAFKDWVHRGNTFCSSLVDRIVTGYPYDNIQEMKEELGYEDEFIVAGEPYHLWVIEGPDWVEQEFPANKVGLNTLFVNDLTPYRTMKVRILNGLHTAMTPVAFLSGMNTVADAVNDPLIGLYLKELLYREIIPSLNMPRKKLLSFAESVFERFKNPFNDHYLQSIALNSIAKFKARNLPTLLAYYEQNNELPMKLVFSFAALIAFYKGMREGGIFQLEDAPDVLQQFSNLWRTFTSSLVDCKQLTANVLSFEAWWGQDLNKIPGFTNAIAEQLYLIEKMGMGGALSSVMAEAEIGQKGADHT